MQKILELLGLTAMEALCYETLLPLGTVPMATLTANLRRHPQIVYRLVASLEEKGLVITETRGHRKYVRAEDPKVLERAQVDRLEQLRHALPALYALQHAPAEAQVRIERGREAIRNLRRRAFSELSAGEIYYILSASGSHFYEYMGDALDEIEKLREKRRIRKKLLAFETQRTSLQQCERWKGTEIRYMPDLFPVLTSTNIYGYTTAIQIWLPDPIVILIESKEVAQSYKDFFETLWKKACR